MFIAFNINHSSILPLMALSSLYCADVPLSNYSLTQLCTLTWESTREINHTSVHCVTEVSARPATCNCINVAYTATEDRMTVLTVGCCLRQTLNWSIMFVFTLVQSRTHVDIVHSVLQGFASSRHICWSHTMKALGWHVRFVRRNLVRVVTLSSIYFDMKEWNRTHAANVQSVSVMHLLWNIISWYTLTTDNFAVVCVVKTLNGRKTL